MALKNEISHVEFFMRVGSEFPVSHGWFIKSPNKTFLSVRRVWTIEQMWDFTIKLQCSAVKIILRHLKLNWNDLLFFKAAKINYHEIYSFLSNWRINSSIFAGLFWNRENFSPRKFLTLKYLQKTFSYWHKFEVDIIIFKSAFSEFQSISGWSSTIKTKYWVIIWKSQDLLKQTRTLKKNELSDIEQILLLGFQIEKYFTGDNKESAPNLYCCLY